MTRFLYSLGRRSVRHRKLVLLLWVAAIGLAIGAAQLSGGQLSDDFRVPGVESQHALDLLKERFPQQAGTTAQVVFHVEHGTLADSANTATVRETLAEMARLPHVVSVADPFQVHAVSPDGATALAEVRYDEQPRDLGTDAVGLLTQASAKATDAGIEVEFGGDLPRFADKPKTEGAELIGIAAAIVILLVTFGSVIAMGMPVGLALFGLTGGLSVVTILASVMDVASVAPILASMIGLGVGIDYALFIITRHRQHLREGMTVEDAAGRATATAGQAVIFAGGTVVIAICGLALVGIPFVATMGYAAALVVAIMVLASVTLLPALLGFAGLKMATSSMPWVRRREAKRAAGTEEIRTGGWQRWGNHVSRHPWIYLVASAGVLMVMTLPLFSMRLGQTDTGNNPTSTTTRRAYDLLASGFGPGSNGPLLITVDLTDTRGDRAIAIQQLVKDLQADPDALFVTPPQLNPTGDTAVFTVIPKSAPQDKATDELVHRIRATVAPAAHDTTGIRAFVGGTTAVNIDMADRVSDRMPWFIGAIVGLSFVLLVLVFRSLLVPLKAALMNLLSIGAAYGVVVAVFQWGWGKGLIGLQETVPIVSFVPMFMFAILFGLSMDYEVFLLSRIREEYLHSKDNTHSVTSGLATTARVIASAALIMITVFFGFVLGDDPIIKMMGIGLATAVFVDATVVRLVLVPATMRLMGNANWWLPTWLDRILPHLDIEGGEGLPEPELRPELLPPPPVVPEPEPVEVLLPVPAITGPPAASPSLPDLVSSWMRQARTIRVSLTIEFPER